MSARPYAGSSTHGGGVAALSSCFSCLISLFIISLLPPPTLARRQNAAGTPSPRGSGSARIWLCAHTCVKQAVVNLGEWPGSRRERLDLNHASISPKLKRIATEICGIQCFDKCRRHFWILSLVNNYPLSQCADSSTRSTWW